MNVTDGSPAVLAVTPTRPDLVGSGRRSDANPSESLNTVYTVVESEGETGPVLPNDSEKDTGCSGTGFALPSTISALSGCGSVSPAFPDCASPPARSMSTGSPTTVAVAMTDGNGAGPTKVICTAPVALPTGKFDRVMRPSAAVTSTPPTPEIGPVPDDVALSAIGTPAAGLPPASRARTTTGTVSRVAPARRYCAAPRSSTSCGSPAAVPVPVKVTVAAPGVPAVALTGPDCVGVHEVACATPVPSVATDVPLIELRKVIATQDTERRLLPIL